MAGIGISLSHDFGNGEESTIATKIGALSATDGAVLEQILTHMVVQSLLRIGAYNATQRDPEFPAKLAAAQSIMGLKPAA